MTNRRQFLTRVAATTAGFVIVPRHVLGGTGYTAPSDQITKAIIGVGGMGRGHINYEGTRLLAICDVDRRHLAEVLAFAGPDVKGYADYREVLQRPDVDVVHIATPPHWHALMSVDAARAGKDIWCEKPMTRTIGEGRRVIDAVRRYGRMFRVNTWFRFKDPFYGMGTDVRPLKKAVMSGALGWPLTVTVSATTGYDWKFYWSGRTDLTPEAVPADLDYEMWLGPAPWKPYNVARVHQNFRGYWDYDGGGLGDMGQHYLDPVQYILGKDDTSPVRVDVDAPQQHYDAAGSWRRIEYTYADGCRIILDGENRDTNAAYIAGPHGRIFRGFRSDVKNLQGLIDSIPDPEPQIATFSESVRTRRPFALNESNAHRSATLVNLGVIAVRLGRTLHFDPEAQQFKDDEAANRLIDQPMRAPWILAFLLACVLSGVLGASPAQALGVMPADQAATASGSGAAGAMPADGVTSAASVMRATRAMPVQAAGAQAIVTSAVTTIVNEFPAESYAARDRLAAALLAHGEPGLADLTRRLTPPAAAGDTLVRYAINAVAVFASQSGHEARRALVEGALCAALAAAPDVGVRTFLLNQLQIVGRAAAVKAATPFLADAALVEPAAQLMLAVGGRDAGRALLAAFGASSGAGRVTIVKALGELRVTAAHDRIARLAADPDPALRRAALASLARLGQPQAYVVMTNAAKAAGFRHEPTHALGSLLDYARQVARGGSPGTGERVCRYVIAQAGSGDGLAAAAGALTVLAEIRGAGALPDLLEVAGHADAAYRNVALAAATRLPGPFAARAWIARAGSVAAPARADIVTMLGRRGEGQALPLVRASLASPDAGVALAAADALARIEGAKAVPDLVPLLASATPEVAARAAAILLWTVDEKSLDPVAAELDAASPAARAAALGVIGARGAKRFAPRVFALVADASPEVRHAARAALAGVASAGDLPALLRLLEAADSDTALPPVQRGVVAAALQVEPAAARAATLVAALGAAANPERIIEVLPQVGGAQALAAVIAQFESPAEARRAAAFRALTRWPGIDATDRLLAIVSSGDTTYRNPAFAAYVRQVSASTLAADDKVTRLKAAVAISSTVGDRRILIRALERIKTLESLGLVAPWMDEADLAGEAAAGVARIALPTSPGANDGLGGPAVRAALEKAAGLLRGPQADADRAAIRAYLAR